MVTEPYHTSYIVHARKHFSEIKHMIDFFALEFKTDQIFRCKDIDLFYNPVSYPLAKYASYYI